MFLRILGLTVWLLTLMALGSVGLVLAAGRIGADRGTSYGAEYAAFTASWGGSLRVAPPVFTVLETYEEEETDAVLKVRRMVQHERVRPLVPHQITLDAALTVSTEARSSHGYRAFEVRSADSFDLRNDTEATGPLRVQLTRPAGAAFVYDHALAVDGAPVAALFDTPVVLKAAFPPGAVAHITLDWATKGVDRFSHDVSAYTTTILPDLVARFAVSSPRFELVGFGLPHERVADGAGERVEFRLRDFNSSQDIGVCFLAERAATGNVAELIAWSPVALGMLLALQFLSSQLRDVRFPAFHFLFPAAYLVFYFVFSAYVLRWTPLPAAFGVSAVLMVGMYAVTVPAAMGRAFAWRVAFPYLMVLTGGFSAVMFLPAYRGIALLILVFALGMSVAPALARAKFSAWPIVRG